ncbi:MAG: hypothetical protein COW84_06465 [Gammaproteobacteria bacterium CG22_combo_CG10-13_8_21_14_all_40_8]|nr:MAG: hypothetical protein COW84_06465 [Gammaproteobacteria bacterium CG22_combo_CG10-13_8_21_14_all_40_8]
MLKLALKKWLTEPRFSLKIFIVGLVVFFIGVSVIFISLNGLASVNTMGWILLSLGILIALPGYIGIWRWRWISFKNDK